MLSWNPNQERICCADRSKKKKKRSRLNDYYPTGSMLQEENKVEWTRFFRPKCRSFQDVPIQKPAISVSCRKHLLRMSPLTKPQSLVRHQIFPHWNSRPESTIHKQFVIQQGNHSKKNTFMPKDDEMQLRVKSNFLEHTISDYRSKFLTHHHKAIKDAEPDIRLLS